MNNQLIPKKITSGIYKDIDDSGNALRSFGQFAINGISTNGESCVIL